MLFKKKKEIMYDIIPESIIGKDLMIRGAEIEGDDIKLRIDGTYKGTINAGGVLIIGESGVVEGNIMIDQAIIAGRIEGDIGCKELIHFAPTARIIGSVHTKAAIVDQGARMDGTYKVGDNELQDREGGFTFKPKEKE